MTETGNDPIWEELRREARLEADREPLLASFMHGAIIHHATLEHALAGHLACKLGSAGPLQPTLLMDLFREVFESDPTIREAIRADLKAVKERDPACRGYSIPFLYFKGFQALQSYRVSNWLWQVGRVALALALQGRISEVFAVDIHPAARIGKGILLDHATSIVIGETAVVKDNVSMLHEVTLGGTGKETGDRHPKVGEGVLIGAGAKILGNIRIGDGSKIGAGSVVVDDIPPHSTAVGVPARVVGRSAVDQPALEMDQRIQAPGMDR
ncbi:MAG: serine O-acetyltransferase [Candidatus Riflebacteria bacterium]|nr:serine O-acetyltransferase [Candidatus Riflebacteria bacterium]